MLDCMDLGARKAISVIMQGDGLVEFDDNFQEFLRKEKKLVSQFLQTQKKLVNEFVKEIFKKILASKSEFESDQQTYARVFTKEPIQQSFGPLANQMEFLQNFGDIIANICDYQSKPDLIENCHKFLQEYFHRSIYSKFQPKT